MPQAFGKTLADCKIRRSKTNSVITINRVVRKLQFSNNFRLKNDLGDNQSGWRTSPLNKPDKFRTLPSKAAYSAQGIVAELNGTA
jgi:hypothetical protein